MSKHDPKVEVLSPGRKVVVTAVSSEAAYNTAVEHLGDDVTLLGTDKTLVGGIGGFGAREMVVATYEVAEVAAAVEQPAVSATRRTRSQPLASTLAETSTVASGEVPAVAVSPQQAAQELAAAVGASSAPFSERLASAASTSTSAPAQQRALQVVPAPTPEPEPAAEPAKDPAPAMNSTVADAGPAPAPAPAPAAPAAPAAVAPEVTEMLSQIAGRLADQGDALALLLKERQPAAAPAPAPVAVEPAPAPEPVAPAASPVVAPAAVTVPAEDPFAAAFAAAELAPTSVVPPTPMPAPSQVMWSAAMLTAVGVPSRIVDSAVALGPLDDATWTAALILGCRDLVGVPPRGDTVFVGPKAARLADLLDIPVVSPDMLNRTAGSVAVATDDPAQIVPGLANRNVHLVVSGRWERLAALPISAVSAGDVDSVPAAATVAAGAGVPFCWLFAGRHSAAVTAVDIALALRAKLPTT